VKLYCFGLGLAIACGILYNI